MAMVSRSARHTEKSLMVATGAPSGGYKYDVAPSSFAVKCPNFAAFGSSDRRQSGQSAKSKQEPGPGSYLEMPLVERREVSSLAFRSGMQRLGPTAPGSTVYAESSAARNPGPGAYVTRREAPQKRPSQPRCDAATRVLLTTGSDSLARRYNPPTIPRRGQTSGYDETKDRCIQPLPPRDLEVLDSVVYDIPSKNKGTCFSRSTTKRSGHRERSKRNMYAACHQQQQQQQQQQRRRPQEVGPGDYDPVSASDLVAQEKKAGPSSFFRSQVPMAFEVKRPETNSGYDVGPAESRPDWPSVLQCFGSTTTKANGWQRKAELPFTAPTSLETPGPGTYEAAAVAFQVKLQQRLTDTPIPFCSTDIRPCLRKPDDDRVTPHLRVSPEENTALERTTTNTPGPGAYETPQQTMSAWGRHGVFGSCSARFPPASPHKMEASNAGPGAYDVDVARHLPKATRPNYNFRSTTGRFKANHDEAQQLNNGGPENMHVGAGEDNFRHVTAPDDCLKRGNHPSSKIIGATFRSTTSRFADDKLLTGERIHQIPGPGAFVFFHS